MSKDSFAPMRRDDCTAFLREILPRLGLRWSGYRRVHRTVCKRLRRRVRELDLAGLGAYRERLAQDAAEWERLDAMCRIPISRFFRDRAVFEALAGIVLPDLAERARRGARSVLHCWSCGCASGEEAYTLAILGRLEPALRDGGVRLEVTASDSDAGLLSRAREGCYRPGTLKEMPRRYREKAFARRGDLVCVRPAYRDGITFLHQDVRAVMPDGPFDLILCRNLAFTYFAPALQADVLTRLVERLRPGGHLVIGRDETLPASAELEAALPDLPIFRRSEARPHPSD